MKVGFFDSGIGGTCILNAFRKLCPDVETEYIADTAHCPYGNRPPDEIIRLSEAIASKLIAHGCGMVVVACNTATAAAIDYLRARYPDVPFVGIEPAIKPAALRSKTGVVGVMATAGTFSGRLYNETKAKFAKNVAVLAVVADEFVAEVEKLRGAPVDGLRRAERERIERIVRSKVEPLLRAGADKIVLGCTHFPHLRPLIEEVCAGRAEVIDPSMAVARQAKRVMLRAELAGRC